ncbi:N,N'-diacetyllegionaminic acid synthase [Candidatus Electrothrix gigas]
MAMDVPMSADFSVPNASDLMNRINISGTEIGSGCPPFIIAEAGINHNGELEKARQMIKTAKACGADAIKFQTFKAEEFIANSEETFTYQSQGQEVTESMLAMFKRYEFSPQEWRLIKESCDKEQILFLSTPQNRSDLELLLELGIPAIKVGSDDFTNLPLLRDYAKTCLPMIVSCGMADLAEVHQALEAIGTLDGYPTILLLCTSQYPTPPKDVNLRKLTTLSQAFPMIIPGFSDHTQGGLASSLALALGACFFEKHFTLDHQLPGPDHWFSEDPNELKIWIASIRQSETMMGSALVRPTPDETKMRLLARRSIVALCDIQAGEKLTVRNIGLKRPGNGLPPSLFDKILNLTCNKNLPQGHLLQIGDVG